MYIPILSTSEPTCVSLCLSSFLAGMKWASGGRGEGVSGREREWKGGEGEWGRSSSILSRRIKCSLGAKEVHLFCLASMSLRSENTESINRKQFGREWTMKEEDKEKANGFCSWNSVHHLIWKDLDKARSENRTWQVFDSVALQDHDITITGHLAIRTLRDASQDQHIIGS